MGSANAAYVACMTAGGFTAIVAIAGVGIPAAVAACNVGQGACMEPVLLWPYLLFRTDLTDHPEI